MKLKKFLKIFFMLLLLTLILSYCDEVKVDIVGKGCGKSYNEKEYNNIGVFSNDFNIVMSPGCKITFKGSISDENDVDFLKINTGNAEGILITGKFSNLSVPDVDIDIYITTVDYNPYDATTSGHQISQTYGINPKLEKVLWKVDLNNFSRHICIVPFVGFANYSLTIEGF